MKIYNCLIIDDNEIDRLTVTSFVKRHPAFHILGVFEDAIQAIPTLQKEDVHVLFLDIDMPIMDGISFRKIAADVPVCIFITSHPEFAVESFELDTLDYIVKPIKYERFLFTIKRIEDYLELRTKASFLEENLGGDTIFIKEGTDQIKIKLHDILYLEALKDYTKIVTDIRSYCVLSNLGVLTKADNFNSFVRVHRSYAIQPHYVSKIQTNNIVLQNSTIIPIGRSYRENVNMLL